MRTVIVTGDALTLDDVIDVAYGEARAELGTGVAAVMQVVGYFWIRHVVKIEV